MDEFGQRLHDVPVTPHAWLYLKMLFCTRFLDKTGQVKIAGRCDSANDLKVGVCTPTSSCETGKDGHQEKCWMNHVLWMGIRETEKAVAVTNDLERYTTIAVDPVRLNRGVFPSVVGRDDRL